MTTVRNAVAANHALPRRPPALRRGARRPDRAGLPRRAAAERVDADGVVSLFLGAYLGELVRRGRVDEEWLDRSLEMVWRIIALPED